MLGSTATAVSDLRAQVEALASDPATDPALRVRALSELRDDLVVVLGAIDSYLGTLGKHREAGAAIGGAMVARLRENAELREELIRRGEMTAAKLDEVGYYDSAELDRLEEEGLLEAVAGELHGRWEAAKHPRGRRGQFTVTDHLAAKATGRDLYKVGGGHDPHGSHSYQGFKKSMDAVMKASQSGMRINVFDPSGKEHAQVKVTGADELDRVEMEEQDGTALTGDFAAGWRAELLKPPTQKPTYSAEVKAITDQASAEAYLHRRGLEALLADDSGADGYRQIAQAVTDAQDRYPSLKTGKRRKLAGVLDTTRFAPSGELDEAGVLSNPHVWGMTGPDPRTTIASWWKPGEVGLSDSYKDPLAAETRPTAVEGDVYVVLNHANDPGEMAEFPPPNALADHSPYGRMMHELGHAVMATSGWQDGSDPTDPNQYAEPIIETLEHAGTPPSELQEISPYGGSSPVEAMAEIFTTINTPGVLAALTEQQRGWIKAIQKAAAETTKEKVL